MQAHGRPSGTFQDPLLAGRPTTIIDELLAAARGTGMPELLRFYYQHRTDQAWANDSTMAAMEELGEHFVAEKAYDAALTAFRINAQAYPHSLPTAIAAVERAAHAAPQDRQLAALLARLTAL